MTASQMLAVTTFHNAQIILHFLKIHLKCFSNVWRSVHHSITHERNLRCRLIRIALVTRRKEADDSQDEGDIQMNGREVTSVGTEGKQKD